MDSYENDIICNDTFYKNHFEHDSDSETYESKDYTFEDFCNVPLSAEEIFMICSGKTTFVYNEKSVGKKNSAKKSVEFAKKYIRTYFTGTDDPTIKRHRYVNRNR